MATPTAALSESSTWETPDQRKAAARETFRRSVAQGKPLTGVQLGPMFGRSARWGTDRIVEVQAEDIGNGGKNALPDSSKAGPSANPPRGEAPSEHRPHHEGFGTATGNGHHDDADRSPLPISNGTNSDGFGQPTATPSAHGNGNNGSSPKRGSGNGSLPIGNRNPTTENTTSTRPDSNAQSEAAPATPGWVRAVTVLAAVAVGLAAATASVEHLQELAILAGEGRPWLLPLSVDGLVVAATMSLYVASRARQPAGAVTWLAFGLGLGASVIGNIIAKNPDLVAISVLRVIVAAWPPVSLALTMHLLLDQIRSTGRSVTT